MAQARYYSSIAEDTTLTATVASGDTVLPVSATVGLPSSFPYTLVVEPDTANQEIVTVTNASGLNLTVTRGEDGTGAVAHDAGAVVSHQHTARDFTESRQHEDATTGVHGITGALVGTSSVQALTNKDLSSATNTLPADLVRTGETQTLTNKTLTSPVFNTLVPAEDDPGLWALPPTTGAGSITNYPIGVSYNRIPSSLETDWPGVEFPPLTGAAVLVTVRARVNAVSTEDSSYQMVFGSAWKYRIWLDGAWSDWQAVVATGGWTSYTPTWTATSTNPAIGNGTITGAYRKVGTTVHFRINLTAGSTSTYGSGVWLFSLPEAAESACAIGGARLNQGSTNKSGSVYIDPSSLSTCRVLHNDGSVTGTNPWTWASTDVLYIQGTYESAS